MKKLGLLTILMLGLTGCPDGSKSNRNQPVYPGGMPCHNCGFSQSSFGSTVSSTLPQGTLTLSMSGDSRQIGSWFSYSNPLFSYQGPFLVSGSLSLQMEVILGACRLPVGNYSVVSVQSGTYSMGVFQVPAVELRGPVSAVVAITDGVILTDGMGSLQSFGLVMKGLQGPSAWNMGMMPGPGMGWGTACGDMIGLRF
ncbi:MAG: hypothetical protein ACK5Y2_05110 [Bdellovibrionales bacterium]